MGWEKSYCRVCENASTAFAYLMSHAEFDTPGALIKADVGTLVDG